MEQSALDKQLSDACAQGDLARAKELLAAGAAIDQPGTRNPVFIAAYNGREGVLRWLLEQGAHPDCPNGKNSTPLMGAAEQGRPACVDILLRAGADTTLKNDSNMTARDYARQHSHAAVLDLLDRNPDEVSFSWRVGNRTLQEVFNFRHKERITLIRNGENGPVEAVARHGFSEIEDDTQLRRAFAEYKGRGGRCPARQPRQAAAEAAREMTMKGRPHEQRLLQQPAAQAAPPARRRAGKSAAGDRYAA